MKGCSFCFLLATIMSSFVSCKKDNTPPTANSEYVVFAWNNLGMHCLNPTYDELVILPPYNTVNVQVVKRGYPPQVMTTGLTVEYSLVNNTTSYGKRQYGGFWTNFTALFGGTAPANDIGLTGTALYGNMAVQSDYFIAEKRSVNERNLLFLALSKSITYSRLCNQ